MVASYRLITQHPQWDPVLSFAQPTCMRTKKEWVVIPTPCMPIMHIQTDSKVPVLKKSSIPVDDINIDLKRASDSWSFHSTGGESAEHNIILILHTGQVLN